MPRTVLLEVEWVLRGLGAVMRLALGEMAGLTLAELPPGVRLRRRGP